MKSLLQTTIGETFLWIVANVVCVIVPTASVYVAGDLLFDWGPAAMSFYVSAAAIASLTWGSWASLVWTRTRVLRTAQEVTALIPGVLIMAIGGLGLWTGFGKWVLWMIWIAAGGGVIATSLGLLKLNHAQRGLRRFSIPMGLFAYPFLTTLLSGAVWGLWYNFVNNPTDGDWRSLVSIATVFVTVISIALTTTIIPCLVSTSLRRASATLLGRPE